MSYGATYPTYADFKRNKPVAWWYDSVIDYMLAHPGVQAPELAHQFRRSVTYMRMILNSDMFKARWEQRRADYSEVVTTSIRQKLLGTMDLTLDIITEQLRDKRGAIPFAQTTKYLNDTLERLGYGAKPSQPSGVSVTVNNTPSVQVTAAGLAEARQLLRQTEEARRLGPPQAALPPVVDVTPAVPEPADPSDASKELA